MDSSQFGRISAAAAQGLSFYFINKAPVMVVRETLRFIDNNFRLQGWQGATFQPWKPIKRQGTILVKTGALRRGFNYSIQGDGVLFYNNIKYARVHNEGFNGLVTVKQHTRSKYGRVKVGDVASRKVKTVYTKTSEKRIQQYTRNMNVIQRQYAPTDTSESPVLNAAITEWLEKDIKEILTL